MRRTARTASIVITALGVVTNILVAFQLLVVWKSFKWEPDSEWDSTHNYWKVDGVKLLWGLLLAYFSSATAVSAVGLWGILKHKASYIRFYRDYSTADFSFCALFIVLVTYGAFLGQTRAGVCEQLSHYPDLMRELLEMGLSVENCERWLERAVFAVLAALFIIMAVRLHFLLALSSYYSNMVRHQSHTRSISSSGNSSDSSSSSRKSASLRRIYLLPRPVQSTPQGNEVELVYAPVVLNSLPVEMQAQAVEAWVQQPSEVSSSRHHRQQSHHRKRSSSGSSSSDSQTGRIRLPIRPDEGLLPSYSASANMKA